MRTVNRLIAIASVASAAMHISAASLRSVWDPKINSRARVAGFEALTAGRIRDWFTASCTIAQATTRTIQIVTWGPGAGPGPSAKRPRPRKVREAQA